MLQAIIQYLLQAVPQEIIGNVGIPGTVFFIVASGVAALKLKQNLNGGQRVTLDATSKAMLVDIQALLREQIAKQTESHVMVDKALTVQQLVLTDLVRLMDQHMATEDKWRDEVRNVMRDTNLIAAQLRRGSS